MLPYDESMSAEDVIKYVYAALKAKGHDPIMQIVGYLILIKIRKKTWISI